MGKKRILVIDDEKDLAQLLKLNLERTGLYEVILASNGDEGLAKVDQEDPDIIILDIRMPGKNGFSVLRDLRKSGAKRRPVIMLTAQGELKSMEKAYALEADHYLDKPFKLDDMLYAIDTVLSLVSLWEEQGNKEETSRG